eukprot:4333469-Heterocapsa_arctica.AAC.1
MVPFACTEYMDNFIAIGQKREPVYAGTCQVEHELLSVGLLTHPVEISPGGRRLVGPSNHIARLSESTPAP